MIIPKAPKLTPEQLAEVRKIAAEFDCEIGVVVGANRNIYAILGDERRELLLNRLEGLLYIDRIDTVDAPFKLMDRRAALSRNVIQIGGVQLGKSPLIIAGHCTIDPKEPGLFYETAAAVKEAGAHVLRGGVWKPRTMPYSYQGDDGALNILVEARARTGLPINLEVMDSHQLDLALKAKADMIQIGTRNALNYTLLKEIGAKTAHSSTLILLKRGRHMGQVNEFLACAEYLAANGNPNILLCPRGTLPTLDTYRNHPDESITPLLKEKSWAPVIVDPSHSVGHIEYVPACALAAMAYGADGLCIETHIHPQKGIGDDPRQAIRPSTLRSLIREVEQIHKFQNRFRG